MASTYSPLKIELIGTGDQSGTWGTTTNTNLGTAIEQAITGSGDVAFSSADVTLTLTNTNTSQTARNLRLNLTGTSGGARNLTVPDIEKFYIVANGLADDVTVKNTTGTTYTVPAGTTGQVFSTGTGIKAGQSFFEGTILSPAAVILGGAINATPVGNISASTGAFTTLAASGTLTASSALNASGTLTSSGTLAVTGGLTLDGAAGTSGQVMVSAGSGNTPTWGNAFVAGMIMLWSGSSATIPSGWLLCDGSSSTPDLRNRFVVGATSTYAVGATGGSADAIVVSHTHTATFSGNALPSHDHNLNDGVRVQVFGGGATVGIIRGNGNTPFGTEVAGNSAGTPSGTVTNTSTGSSGTNANLPPYYALCYIMKA